MQTAAIDVIISAWNAVRTIERAVRSVASADVVRSVLVVDDSSCDDTAARAKQLAEKHAKLLVLCCGANKGPSAARNLALEHASAPRVALLDSDDFMLANRLERLLAGSDCFDFVVDNPLQVAFDAAPEDRPKPMLGLSAPSDLDFAGFVRGNIGRRGRKRREMGFLKPLMRREFLDRHALRYDESVRLGEDYLLYARALAKGARFRLVPAAGYVAVMRRNSLSGRHTRRDLECLRAADLALLSLPGLSRRALAAVRAHLLHQDSKIGWLEMIEAVKARDAIRIMRCFTQSPAVSAFIARELAHECVRRTVGPCDGVNLTGFE